MPIDEYNRQLLPESKSTQMGNLDWTNLQNVMIMLQYIFSQVLVLISEHLSYFRVLHISKRFYSPSASIFRVLLFSECFYFPSAFIFQALLFSQLFCFPSTFVFRALLFFFRALLFLFSKCKPALIFYSSKYETVSNFFQNNFLIIFLY